MAQHRQKHQKPKHTSNDRRTVSSVVFLTRRSVFYGYGVPVQSLKIFLLSSDHSQNGMLLGSREAKLSQRFGGLSETTCSTNEIKSDESPSLLTINEDTLRFGYVAARAATPHWSTVERFKMGKTPPFGLVNHILPLPLAPQPPAVDGRNPAPAGDYR
eukprot:s604_g5.t1